MQPEPSPSSNEAMQTLVVDELVLEPLVVAHAPAMFVVLGDPAIYTYLDYPPPVSLDHLRDVYSKLEARKSPDGRQLWLNWVIRPRGGQPIGYVQATVMNDGDAWIAYVLGSAYQGQGFATRASRCVMAHLRSAYDVRRYLATIEAKNRRSAAVLERLGFLEACEADARAHSLGASERLLVAQVA